MSKILSEIIAAFIPVKWIRNRWRGILRYGPIRAIKLKHYLKKNNDVPYKYYLTVCAIAKNEGAYFKEWIDWHVKMGVEKFYIYDNESTDDTHEILRPYIDSGIVEYTFWKGRKQQIPAYDDCFDKHRLDARWIAVIDLDEFIIPIVHDFIPEYLKELEKFSSVEINWLIYGSSGAKHKEEGSVMERFKYHSKPSHRSNRNVKSIVNPRKVFCMSGCHEAARISGDTVDSRGVPINKHCREREPQQEVIRINHYFSKSYDEFLAKRDRGLANKINAVYDMERFYRYDLNDILDENWQRYKL